MEQGTGCARPGRMSKVAVEDGRETCTFLPARGRFLLRNRGTQLGAMCWLCASLEPGSMSKTRERSPYPSERRKKRNVERKKEKERKRREEKRRKEEREGDSVAIFLRSLTSRRCDFMACMVQAVQACPFYGLTEQVYARDEIRTRGLSLKGRIWMELGTQSRAGFRASWKISDMKNPTARVDSLLCVTGTRACQTHFSRHISICGR